MEAGAVGEWGGRPGAPMCDSSPKARKGDIIRDYRNDFQIHWSLEKQASKLNYFMRVHISCGTSV